MKLAIPFAAYILIYACQGRVVLRDGVESKNIIMDDARNAKLGDADEIVRDEDDRDDVKRNEDREDIKKDDIKENDVGFDDFEIDDDNRNDGTKPDDHRRDKYDRDDDKDHDDRNDFDRYEVRRTKADRDDGRNEDAHRDNARRDAKRHGEDITDVGRDHEKRDDSWIALNDDALNNKVDDELDALFDIQDHMDKGTVSKRGKECMFMGSK